MDLRKPGTVIPAAAAGMLLGASLLSGMPMIAAPPEASVTGSADPAEPSDTEVAAYFSARDPFQRRLSREPRLQPGSQRYVRLLRRSGRQGSAVAWRRWSIPVYDADRDTPWYPVSLTAPWAPVSELSAVPIPSSAVPDPAGDGHMAVVDPTSGCEYDLWQARRTSAGWQASWGNAIPLSGNGVYPRGLSARGSGFALTSGLITAEELRRGRIRHALAFSYDFVREGGPVRPATESDGTSHERWALPEGARLQLDPSLRLRRLKLPHYALVIARAMKRYGLILVDSGGGVTLYAENPLSAGEDAYAGLLPDEAYPSLAAIPWRKVRVLRLPRQQRDPDIGLPTSTCAQFSR